MYDRTSMSESVDECRKHLFTKKGRTIDALPPTSAALYQHIKRAVYQGGHCWGQAAVKEAILPDPKDWGWQTGPNRVWEPLWTVLPEASKACCQLVKCGCNVELGCHGNCKCHGLDLKCTTLCKCSGDCEQDIS